MRVSDVLEWYLENRFTAEDVTRATGLSERSQRELLRLGILQAIPQARTKARLMDARMVKRAAVIAPLNKVGLSLEVAGRISYAAPSLEEGEGEFGFVEPPRAGLWTDLALAPPDVQRPYSDRDFWFDPDRPPVAEDADYRIQVVDGRYVAHPHAQGADVFGELTENLTQFVWWRQYIPTRIVDVLDSNPRNIGPRWEWDRSMGAEMLKFTVKDVSAADLEEAQKAWKSPTTLVSINASLALRRALRRLLWIDPPAGEQG